MVPALTSTGAKVPCGKIVGVKAALLPKVLCPILTHFEGSAWDPTQVPLFVYTSIVTTDGVVACIAKLVTYKSVVALMSIMFPAAPTYPPLRSATNDRVFDGGAVGPETTGRVCRSLMWGIIAAVLGGAVALAALESATDLLRSQGKPETPRRVELLEKQKPRGEQTGSQAAEGSSATGNQQQRRAFTTAARGFAAGAARSAHLLPKAV